MASVSSASPSSSPWKLPPLSTTPSSANTSGLSDDGAELALQHAAGEGEGRARRAVHLRHAAQAVGVLHARAVAVRLDDAAVRGQPAEVGGDRLLRGVRPQRVDARVERRVGAHQRFQRHGAGHVGQPREPAGVEHGQHAQPRHEVRAVEQGQSFLGLERQRPHAGGLQRLSGGHSPPVDIASPSPMRQAATWASGARSPGRSDRSLLGDDRMDAHGSGTPTSVSTTLGRTPEAPRASEAASRSISARVSASASAGPTPPAWLSTRLRCSAARSAGGITTSLSLPTPVVMP